jgi:signal-transduction protein with cAMP-binding, CBS, and nucleotidyltransferase domain
VTVTIDTVLRAKGHHVETNLPSAPILDVVQQMRVQGIGAVVVSGDGEHIDGIISERDIVLGLAHDGAKLLSKTADQMMTKSVLTCSPSDKIVHVMAMMTRRRVRHVPVLADGRICGIISIGDVLKNRLEELELETNVLRDVYLARH